MAIKTVRQKAREWKDRKDGAGDHDRFAVDRLLRECGFTVLGRPRVGPVVWTRLGRSFTQARALGTVPCAEVVRALAAERAHRQRKWGEDRDCEGR